MNKKNHRYILLFDFVLMIFLITIDQITKYYAIKLLRDRDGIDIIPDILELSYLENRGAAFGMLQNQKLFFIFITIIVLSVILYIILKTPCHAKYTKLHIALIFVSSGALGNMIDRMRLNYVVDFIYISLIHFPVFNVADIYVTVSSAVLVFFLCFCYKENDLNFLSLRTKHIREIK